MDLKELMKNKDLVLSWMEDEESEFIFERRCEFSTTGNINPIREIAEKYIPEFVLLKKFYELIENKDIYIWGAGQRMYELLNYMSYAPNARVCGIIDASEKKFNCIVNFRDEEIMINSPDDVDFSNIDNLVITMKDNNLVNNVIETLKNKPITKDKIIAFSDYCKLDTTFEKQYFEDFIKYGKCETFVDAGVFDLTTSIMFFEQCKANHVNEMKSLAFEPDSISFERCTDVKKSYPNYNIQLINSALYSKDTTLNFLEDGSEGACVSEHSGASSVDAKALDSYTDEKITFIKMDIEGAELEALKGCERTIKQYKPKLAICVYHKPEDIIEIPMYIKSICPDYKLYLRHYGNFEFDTVLYALPY